MTKFNQWETLTDSYGPDRYTRNVAQSLSKAVTTPLSIIGPIQQSLQRLNFKFHRKCSLTNLCKDGNVGEGKTLLMYWSGDYSESKVTMSVTPSSCSSVYLPLGQNLPNERHEDRKDLRTTGQQTELSCRNTSGLTSPVVMNLCETEEQRLLRARLADSLNFSSPTHPGGRSMSILGSVCALLLNKQGSSVAPKEALSLPTSPNSENICRICFGGESAERLVRPCSCRGTIAAVHRTCLERWLLQAATSYCELCRHHYVVTRSHKWSWMRSLIEWARSGRGRALAADVWRGAALGAASVLGTARALHAADRVLQVGARSGGGAALAANLFSSLLIGIIGALNGLLTTWMLLKIQEHQLSWQAWRDSTLHVHVTLADEESSRHSSERTIVAEDSVAADVDTPTTDRSTNVDDPFMVALPYTFQDFN